MKCINTFFIPIKSIFAVYKQKYKFTVDCKRKQSYFSSGKRIQEKRKKKKKGEGEKMKRKVKKGEREEKTILKQEET